MLGTDIPQNEIGGSVVNKASEPLAGASLVIKRTGKGTQTDANGKFILKNVLPGDQLTVSFTGYKSKTITIGEVKKFPWCWKLLKMNWIRQLCRLTALLPGG